MCTFSPVGEQSKEASNRSGFGETVAAEGSCSDALKRAASRVKISLLSNYPKRQRQYLGAGRITDDAREKEITNNSDAVRDRLVVTWAVLTRWPVTSAD